MNVYVASSWRNVWQPAVVRLLRSHGYEVYDFKNPRPSDHGFHWSEIDEDWKDWSPEQYRKALKHPVAEAGFKSDMDALRACGAAILVLPCGNSAHLELGWAAGNGKRTAILFPLDIFPTQRDAMGHSLSGYACVRRLGRVWAPGQAEANRTRADGEDDSRYSPIVQRVAVVDEVRCAMVTSPGHEDSPDLVCGKSARRVIAGQPSQGCCDDCYAEMLTSSDFKPEELAREFPLISELRECAIVGARH